MQELHDLLKQVAKKIGDKQSEFYYGVEYSHERIPEYRATLVSTKKGVAPVVFGAGSKNELINDIKKFIKDGDRNYAAVKYLENQIQMHENGITYNKKLIKEYEKLK